MIRKIKKPALGFIGLIVVAIMTVIAYFIPTEEAAAADGTVGVDQLQVVVYDENQSPEVSINAPTDEAVVANSSMEVNVTYQNVDAIDFIATYLDENGNPVYDENGDPVEVFITQFVPSDLDPELNIASGEETVLVDLSSVDLPYGNFVITAIAHSPIGYDEDEIEITYVPAKAYQREEDEEETGDPVVVVEYDDGVEKIEVMPHDKDGNPLLDEPIVIEVPAPYTAGSEEVTLPFASYGIPSGEEYYIELTAYKHTPAVDENGDPIYDGDGNPVMVFGAIDAPNLHYPLTYQAPEPPVVPDTGRMLEDLNIAKSDYLITASLVMVVAVVGAFMIIRKSQRRDYRKNYRRRK